MVKVSVKKKPVASEKEENKPKDNIKHNEDKVNTSNNGLLSLGQYDSDDEDD